MVCHIEVFRAVVLVWEDPGRQADVRTVRGLRLGSPIARPFMQRGLRRR